jgi:hypothetical protein
MFQIIISTNNQATLRILTVYAIVIDLGVSNPKYKFYNQTKIIGTNTANNFFSTLSLQNN